MSAKFKKCSCCGKDLKMEDVKHIGNMDVKTKHLKLYNCKSCGTTMAVQNEEYVPYKRVRI